MTDPGIHLPVSVLTVAVKAMPLQVLFQKKTI